MDLDEERALQVAAAMLDVVYVVRLEPDQAFEYVSPSVVDLVGYTPEEHYADPGLGARLLDPRDREVMGRATGAALDETVGFTVRWIHRDGRTVWTEHRCRKLRRDDGSVAIYGAARDVSEHREQQQRLAETEQRYRMLAENSSDLVFATDADATMTWVAPTAQEVLGWPPEQLIGHRLDEYAHPDDRARLFAALAAGAHGIACEARLRTPDGAYRWLSITSRAVLDDPDVGRVGAARDIQAEHDARDALVESEARYRTLVEHASDFVIVLANDNTLRYAAPSVTTLLGWDLDEVIGHLPMEFLHPDDLMTAAAAMATAQSGRSARRRVRIRLTDGTYRWFAGVMNPVFDAAGQVSGRVASFHDIDDQVRAERSRSQSDALLRATIESLLDPHVLLRAIRGDDGPVIDFEVLAVNQSTEEALERPRDELLTSTALTALPCLSGSALFAALASTVETGRPLALEGFRAENGAPDDERRIDLRAVPLEDGLAVTWRDVTAH